MKYIFLNDASYLVYKRKMIILLLLLVPFIIFLTNLSNYNYLENIEIIFGLNLQSNNINIMEIIMFLFNIVLYVFLIIDIYTKDILYQLDNIFLRMPIGKWIFYKSVAFCLLTFILKLMQYLIIIVCLSLFNQEMLVSNILKLCLIDFLYISGVQFMIMNIYLLGITIKKFNVLFILFSVALLLIIPKNILNISNCLFLLILGVILLIILIVIQVEKKSQIIIERVRV